jgi:hypothetical protein
MAQTIASSRLTPVTEGNPRGKPCRHANCRSPDWSAVSKFPVGTGHIEPSQDTGYTTARNSIQPILSITFLAFGGSPDMKVRRMHVSDQWTSWLCGRGYLTDAWFAIEHFIDCEPAWDSWVPFQEQNIVWLYLASAAR